MESSDTSVTDAVRMSCSPVSSGWNIGATTPPGSPGARTIEPNAYARWATSTRSTPRWRRTRKGAARLRATSTASASVGIGHTRWATHGGVTERNAHPHADASGRFRIVLNGIIENYRQLRERLAADLIECSSDTDAEVVAQLIALNYDGDLADAVRRSLG